jgi:hypothetical protein
LKFVYHGNTSIEAKIWKFISCDINMYKVHNFHTMVWLSWCWNVWYQRSTLYQYEYVDLMCHFAKKINATFCTSWKEKIFDEPFKNNQQNIGHNKIDL